MASYASLPILGRVKLPNNTVYALVDVDGREMIAPTFASTASYSAGDYVIYRDPSADPAVDNLYVFNAGHTGAWTGNDVTQVTVTSEIKRALETISGGIHYRGKTTSKLYEGSTLNPIIINGSSTPVEAGDMVTEDVPNVAVTYATGTAYAKGDYVKYGNAYYQVNTAITAAQNTSWEAVADKMGLVKGSPMFIWAEGQWTMLSGVGDGLGDLAYKDSASGTYTRPSGTGSVTIKNVSVSQKALDTTSIKGVAGTDTVSKMTAGTAVAVATVGTAKRYGTADVGEAVTYGTADVGAAVTYGTANRAATATTVATAGSTFNYGTADVDTAVTVATKGAEFVYGTADVGSAVTYGTANPDTPVTGIAKVGTSKTFSQNAIKLADTPVQDVDCLVFTAAGSASVIGVADTTGVSITPAVASDLTLTPAKAASTSQKANLVGTTSITPAKSAGTAHSARGVAGTTDIYQAVDSTTKLTPAVASTKTLTPAVAAPSDQTIVPAVANGTITPWTETAKTVATANANATTVVVGLKDGTGVVTGVTQGTESATVTVGTTTDTVVVK